MSISRRGFLGGLGASALAAGSADAGPHTEHTYFEIPDGPPGLKHTDDTGTTPNGSLSTLGSSGSLPWPPPFNLKREREAQKGPNHHDEREHGNAR